MPVEYGHGFERVPGNFSREEKNHFGNHGSCGARGARAPALFRARTLFVSKRNVYFLEVNPAPAIGMTEQSLFPKALHAVGAKMADFS